MLRRTLVLTLAASAVSCNRELFASSPTISAVYTIDLRSATPSRVEVALELANLPPHGLRLGALVADHLFRADVLNVVDGQGRSIAMTEQPECDPRAGNSRFTRYQIDYSAVPEHVVVRYAIRPTTRKVRNPCGEEQHYGYVAEDVCYLPGFAFLLVPDAPVALLEVGTTAREDWVTINPSVAIAEPISEDLWNVQVVAGRFAEVRRVGGRPVDVFLPRVASPDVYIRIEDALTRLASRLAEPQPFTLVVLGSTRNDLRVDAPSTPGWVVLNMPESDLLAMREMIRKVLPAWYGSTQRAWADDLGRAGWFPLGLSEYLALVVPEEMGLANTSARRSIEYTWMLELDGMRSIPLAELQDLSVPLPLRRAKAAALVMALDNRLRDHGGLEALTKNWNGRGLPVSRTPVPEREYEAFLEDHVERATTPMAFEDGWSIPLGSRPASLRGEGVRTLHLAFTSNTFSFIENCGCSVSQSGGVTRRAAALKALREKHGNLITLDTGNFFPLEKHRRSMNPLLLAETEVYLRCMSRMEYSLACVGSNELCVGADKLGEMAAAAGLTLVGNVLVEGRRVWPVAHRLEHGSGMRLGLFGHFEKYDHGHLQELSEHYTDVVRFSDDVQQLVPEISAIRGDLDLVIVFGHISPVSLLALTDPSVGVDLVIDGLRLDGVQEAGFSGDTLVVRDQMSTYGLNHLELHLDSSGRIASYALRGIELTGDAKTDAKIDGLLDEFYGSEAVANAGMKPPLFQWDAWAQADYGGMQSCRGCHPSEYTHWAATKHGTAMQTLRRARRSSHAECVRCHVLGLGRDPGYRIGHPEPAFEGVQCESCHGSGGSHVLDPRKTNIRLRPTIEVCMECHDDEHSPGFPERFELALTEVRHRP